jgi:hypothetical protein
MIPEKTVLHGNDDSKYKQLTLERWVYETLKQWANGRNGTMSKGVILYEALLFEYDEVTDTLSETESILNAELEREGIDTEQISSTNRVRRSDAREQLRSEVSNPDEKLRDVKIWLPETVDTQVPWSRGWNDRIATALVSIYMSKYADRADRVRCKREILEYVTDETKPSHQVATKLIEDGIADPEITTIEEYKQQCDDVSQWAERFTILRQLYDEYHNLPKKVVVDTVVETHGIGRDYASKKVDEFAEKYDLYEHAPVGQVDVTRDTFPELVDRYGDYRKNLATLVNGLLKQYEADGRTKPLVADLAKDLENAGLVSNRKQSAEFLKELDSDYGIPVFDRVYRGQIYLDSHIAQREPSSQ